MRTGPLRLARVVAAAGLGVLGAASPAAPDEPSPEVAPAVPGAAGTAFSEGWRKVATLEIPVEEVSGAVVLGREETGDGSTRITLLLVSDEGRYAPEERALRGCLQRVTLRTDGERLRAEPPRPVAIATGDHLARIDPAWADQDASPVDLEALAALPGSEDLILVAGERNPEDQTDDGANRLYLVRLGAPEAEAAELVAYFRLHDLPDDLLNDRFEGMAVTPGDAEGRWHVWLFKERTAFPERRVGYVHGILERTAAGFTFRLDEGPGWPPLRVRFLAEEPGVVLQQSDACRAPDGGIWVLDRWKRVVHTATADGAAGVLRRTGSLDYFDLVKEILGETSRGEPSTPGLPERRGFGRHEGIAVDAAGWVYLAADRGGGAPSTLTVLAPRR